MFKVAMDGLPLELVELDATPVEKVNVPFVVLNVGQRASVILNWTNLDPSVRASPALGLNVYAITDK